MYIEFGSWLTEQLGHKTQKISVNAGFTCPNRDGSVGVGGCTYCNNQTFNPDYCRTSKSITQQLEEGKQFFSRKYPDMNYLAYFQAYTNTYGTLEHLIDLYEEALRIDKVVGLVIGTRPDCMPDELLNYLEELNRRTFLIVEYGIESVYDRTLCRINRGHDYATTKDAIVRTAARGIRTGGHIIIGLPGETRNDIINEAQELSTLPLTTLKLHQLQVIKGTKMEDEFRECPEDFMRLSADEYAELVMDFIQNSRPDIVFERFVSQSPPELLAIPGWGLKNYQFMQILKRKINNRQNKQ